MTMGERGGGNGISTRRRCGNKKMPMGWQCMIGGWKKVLGDSEAMARDGTFEHDGNGMAKMAMGWHGGGTEMAR